MTPTFAQPIDWDARYLLTIKKLILDASNNSSRSRQRAIGPSEVGEPCARKLAYKLLDITETNTTTDPLPSVVGTGAHANLADTFTRDNATLGYQRWWVEERVQCGPFSGSCDLYDADTRTVVDHKFPGESAMRKYRSTGPSDVYRIQAHLYGMGNVAAGRPVDRVAIIFYPRGGMLGSTHIWSEPYDEKVATDAIDRVLAIGAGIDTWMDLTSADKGAALAAIPATPSRLCNWCPFLSYGSTELSTGCPGEAQETQSATLTQKAGTPS